MKRFFMASGVDQDVTVSSQEMEHHLDDCSPQTCVLYSHSPSVQVYFALKNRLEKSSEAWLKEFVALGGLESLLDSLCHMVGPKFSGFSDAILQIDCLSCIRAVLNSPVGLDALVASPGGLRKLLKGVDLANTLPRKHVIEIMSVVCLYSHHAYKSLLEAMEEHKRDIHMYHRFSFIVNELKLAETVPHKTAVLTLINSIICSTPEQQARCRIRSLTLLDVLAFLQREDTDEDLSIQLQVFQDKKHEDEVAIDLNSSLDLSSPQDLVDAVQTRVFGSAKMVSFVNILQDLLAVETSNKHKSDVVWQIIESHVHHIVHAAENIDSLSILEAETLCQVIESASKDGCRKAEVYVHPLYNNGSQSSQGGGNQNLTRRPDTKRISTSGQTERRETVTPRTPADSGYIGCEDKLSPPVSMKETKDLSSSQNNSPRQIKLRPPSSTNTTEKGSNSDSDLKISVGNVAAPITSKRQMSMYDNMSPEKGFNSVKMSMQTKFDYDKYKQLKLNNLNVPLITVSETTKILRDPSLGLRNIQGNEPQDLNAKAALSAQESNDFNMMVFPTDTMKNLKWIKLDDSVVDLFPHSLWASTNFKTLKLEPDFRKVEEAFKDTNISENVETPLLSNETRVKLNLFLNRLEEEPTELVKRLLKMDGPPLSLPFMKHLVDILPEPAELAGANTIVREGFDGFLEEVKSEFRELQGQITELKYQSQRLSEFFCESDGFELQSCFRSLLSFFKELRRCRHEMHMLLKQKDLSIKRSNVFKQQLARKNNAIQFGQKATANSSAMEIKPLLVEEMLTELHRGNFNPSPLHTASQASSLATNPDMKSEADRKITSSENNTKAVDAAPVMPSVGPCEGTEARCRDGKTTPDRDLNPMELSHISVIGTPMMNRPSSDAFDEELTLAALDLQPRQVTSSVRNLGTVQAVSTVEMRAPPVFSMQHPLGRVAGKHIKTHHRSRSDLGESMNGSSRWIRYQNQLRNEFQAPLARPESSMTLATLNLESAASRRPLTQLSRPVALVPGPTVAMPSCVDATEDLDPQEFVRGGKRGERKSGTLSNFLTKISKRVLRQKNPSVENYGRGVGTRTRSSYSGSDGSNSQDGLDKHDGAGENKGGQKYKPKPAPAKTNLHAAKTKYRAEDKENIHSDVNPFDRQKKNPIRLSNRFKSKLTK
ncbi:inverted formin-2 [Elysia marginata]|uniref:Inverted formin-2 n=1 Tax=Elysia marginata TaxID=1093978 RepID=A0AAV4EJK6_9GAST|nr:inverted formin-2 [Elysia marginata]